MTLGEWPPGSGVPDIWTSLAEAGVEMREVEASRRLIGHRIPGRPPTAEFISPQDVRLLAVLDDSPDAAWRTRLEESNVPVPERLGHEGVVELWFIPPGTKTIGSVAHLIAANPQKYGGLLHAVGEAHRRAFESEVGAVAPVEGVRMVDRFAFAPDVKSPNGIRVFLVPPYHFDPELARDGFAHTMYDELAAIPDMFTPQQLLYLGEQMQEGGGGI
jgi:hypothetical protein